MPVSESDLIDALVAVTDPMLGREIGRLAMFRSGTVAGDRGHCLVAVPAEDYPNRSELAALLNSAGQSIGLAGVDVEFSVFSEDEQRALRIQLIGDPAATAGSHVGHGHAEGREIPFSDPGSKTRILLIASGKGGVGKSSVTTNLAVALAAAGKRTAVIDADVWGFSIPRMLGVEHPPVAIDQMLVPAEANGVRCISMGFFANEDQPVIWRGPMLHKALEQFLTDVFWDEPDYLLIDLPPGTGDISLSISKFLPRAEVLVVTTPQPAAQKVAQRAAFMAEKVNLLVRGVIENMSWFTGDDGKRYEIFGAGGGQDLAERLDVPLVGRIPLVTELREGGDTGAPVTVVDPDSEAAMTFVEMARVIDEELQSTRRYHPELKLI
ncbi:MAG: Mrp/NBP35 family ATP-binding protein [Actinomycetia bacterium]|nr:Mrp/NBP35 family ATP-binding protein [Actinomycetes bacterium]MCP4960723.1 Mrp/NBP35 family ATP-binding protein [Actinomycetes bacterium]